MNSWVFKATPKGPDGSGYDYAQELRAGREESWESVEFADPMSVGDRVYFWASSPLRHLAGLGVITGINPKGGVLVRYLTNIFPNPPPIEVLKAHPALNDTRFFKAGSYDTEYRLTEAEARALYGLVVVRNPDVDIWRDGAKTPAANGDTNPALFAIGAKFSDRLIPRKAAIDEIVKLGISSGSASNYLYNSRHLLAGRCYKREMTIAPTAAFLNWIKERRSPQEYQNSLRALDAHLQYLEGRGKGRPKHRELLARVRGERNSETNWLGHRKNSGAARLDEMLARGATMDELKQARGGVHEHIRHLREKWGIQCEERDGKWRMVGSDKSAHDDLPEGPPTGCEDPKKNTRTVTTYTRDPAVRAYVLSQAKGLCEYCGNPGFVKPNGESYLEAHHLLALSEDGPDTTENVVALCANHHREAHYGRERATLEAAVLAKRRETRPAGQGQLGHAPLSVR